MHTLASLSDEVLARILEFSHLDMVTLWTAGNLDFNTRIARCCTIVCTQALRFPKSLTTDRNLKLWPRMLSELLALKELEISVDNIQEPIGEIIACVKKLSPTLEKLRLRFSQAPYLLLLNHAECAASHNTKAPIFWKIAEIFPKLRQLHVWESEYVVGNSLAHSTDLVDSLPSSLEELSWGSSIPDSCDYSRLPQGLTLLGVGFANLAVLTATQAAQLPRSLKTLSRVLTDVDCFDALPKTLELGIGRLGSVEALSALPPAVKTLELSTFNAEFLPLLPKKLTRLSLMGNILLPEHVALLPHTIVTIRKVMLNFGSFVEILHKDGSAAVQAIWPNALTRLSFEKATFGQHMSASELAIFPPALKALRQLPVSKDFLILDHIDLLPPALEDFWAVQANVSAQSISSPLPHQWKKLRLDRVSLSKEHFSLLPPYLKTLRLSHTSLLGEDCSTSVAQIPRSVALLELAGMHQNGFSELPASLTRLGLGHQLTKAQISAFPSYLDYIETDDISYACEPIESSHWFSK